MDVVLPYRIRNEQKFFDCAFKLGFDEMSVHKFLYMFHLSDVDTFPKMGDDRITVLIYGWELCEDYKLKMNDDEWELPEEMEVILKILVPWSLDIWFSREWDRCKVMLRYGLIHCLNRARGLLMRSPDMMQINWEFLLLYNQTPWQVLYLKSLTVKKEKTLETGGQTIEMEELPPSSEDLNYTKLEQYPLIVLRLVKLFDQGSIDMVKTLCMRVLAAWNKIYHTELETAGSRLPYVPPEDKRCLLLICHIYLMAVYEADDVKGYVIDNMINNIRFYYQSFQTNTTSYAMDNLSYTPARFIALTSIHLRLQKRELFDFFIWNSSESSPVNLFGVVSQAYKSYLLGNLLMELNNMNDDNFASNTALYKRLMNSYVNEREKSEIFMIGEMQKLEAQRYAHNIQNALSISDFKSKICKGNRMSNIGNYENTDDIVIDNKDEEKVNKVEEAGEEEGEEMEELCVEENELSVDPIFQNIPNNEEVLYYVYDVLSKKSYRGWQFAKIVLLFKIISHELNMLETWRYHPGLTINFMLNLETKLSQHYIDLAKIFKDYAFMEQEFWLTAFYLNPSQQSYEAVKRLGIRNNRKRNEEPTRWSTGRESIEAKYGLLSSTIDVKEIVVLTNTDDQNADYVPLTEALHSLHLPDSVIKDILTVIFLPRNKGFSWAVEWNDLRRRCKMLMSNTSEKKRCVELTMAEANDRLKFLNIDYAKYKNRPQLDYGSIEQGYENLTGDIDGNSDGSEEEDDFEDDEDVYESQKGNTIKKQEEAEVVEDDNSQEDDPYLTGRRRTRARTAAAMASLLCTTEMTTRRKRRLLEEELSKENEEQLNETEEKSNDSKSTEIVVPVTPSTIVETTSDNPETQKRNIKECLKERPLFLNSTEGFRPLIDMWNIDKSELQTIDVNCVSLLESSSILNRFAKLKSINKQNNPMSTNEEEQIDQVEMVIKHEKTLPKLEKIPEINKELLRMHSPPVQGLVEMDKVKEPKEKTESQQSLEPKLQGTQEEDNRVKSENESENKTDDNNENKFCQNSESLEDNNMETDQEPGADNNIEIGQEPKQNNNIEIEHEPILMETDPELIDNNMGIDQEPILMTSDSEQVDNREISPEPTLIASDSELIDFEALLNANDDISADIVETDVGNKATNEISSLLSTSKPQESLPELSSLKDQVTDMDVNDPTDSKTTPSDMTLINSNENKLVAEQKHITENSALNSPSPLVSTGSNVAVTILTDDMLEIDNLLDVNDKRSAKQENLNSCDNLDNRGVLENVSMDQSSDVIPLLTTEEGKLSVQETDTEENLPGISSTSDSHETKRNMEAQSSDDSKEADMDYGELKSVIDATPTCEIEAGINWQDSVENTAEIATDINLQDSVGNTAEIEPGINLKNSVEDLQDSVENTAEIQTDISLQDLVENTAEIETGINLQDSVENTAEIETDINLLDSVGNTAQIETDTSLQDAVENMAEIETDTNLEDLVENMTETESDINLQDSVENTAQIETDINLQDSVEKTAEVKSDIHFQDSVEHTTEIETDINLQDSVENSAKIQAVINLQDSVETTAERETDINVQDSVEDTAENETATNLLDSAENTAEIESDTNLQDSIENTADIDTDTNLRDSVEKMIEIQTEVNFKDSVEEITPEMETDINLQHSGENTAEIDINLQESVETTATKELCLTGKSNLGMTSSDNPLQNESDEIRSDLEEVPTDITENKYDTDESSANINEADIVALDFKESDTTNKETVDMILPDLDSNISPIDEAPSSNNNEPDIFQCSEEIKSVTNETPSTESGIIETLITNDELLSVVDDGQTTQKVETTNTTSEIDMHLLSSEEIKSDTNQISNNKIEPDKSLMGANEDSFTNVEEVLADESAVDKAVEVTQEIPFKANIFPSQFDDGHADINAALASEHASDIPSLESEKNKFVETPVSNRSVEMPSLDSAEIKCVTCTTPDQKFVIDTSAVESETCKSVVDETTADLLPMENDENQSEVDKIYNSKKSEDMPSLYSDESKSLIDYNLSQEYAADMPTLDSEESKDKSLAPKILRNDSIESSILQEINDENNKMKELCITRPIKVLIRKLRPSDLVNLRQPRVRVKRIRDVGTVLEEVVPKRTRLHRRVYVDVDESSDSLMSNSSTSSMYRPPGRPSKSLARRTKLLQKRTSDSDCDSNNSFRNVRKRCVTTPNANSNHSNISAKSSSRASTVTSGNLVVIPRSASGLKLRISHADQNPALNRPIYEPIIVVDEIIQVSSSSNDESNTMDSIVEVPEDEPDPLYEEAVIELHKTR